LPERRHHRGPDPEDEQLFGPHVWPELRQATDDLCWLLNRGYALPSAIELVGNRYGLARRQRQAVGRCAAAPTQLARRASHRVEPSALRNEELWLDGYNVLTGLEAALAGGVILLGRDGCCRDMAGVHAGYHQVAETLPALRLVGALGAEWGVRQCCWWLDRPVSNSGRLKETLLACAAEGGWDWQVELDYNPDKVLSQTTQIVASADSVILDRCQRWFNLVRCAIDLRAPSARLVDLSLASAV
jgi:hypothetical protein